MYDPTKPYKKAIGELVRSTWNTPYVRITPGLYSLIERHISYPEVDHTDGIGTKGYYHWRSRSFSNAVLDALAMNLNDLVLMRAVPYKLQNHITLPEDDHAAILEIVSALAKECRKRNIAMTGGETSIHAGTDALDLSITVSGFVKEIKANQFQIGDVLIGLPSSGLHSNGFTKVREIFHSEIRPEFTDPTKIYSDDILALEASIAIHGMMHITGGAFTKLLDILPGDAEAHITADHALKPQQIFYDLFQRGMTDAEMYKTFNCGIGFIFSISEKDIDSVLGRFPGAVRIGFVQAGVKQVVVDSFFSKTNVVLI